MKSLSVILCFLVLQLCTSTLLVELYQCKSADPTKINNVENGSKLFLASSDKAVALSKITLSSNGQSRTLQSLLNDFDANGFSNGFPVNSDLTIANTNSEDVTADLSGVLFISNPAMAKDPNFLVYVVSDQMKKIDRSATNETTLVLLNKRVEPNMVGKPFYNSRVDSFIQPATSTILMYRGIPGDGYTDPKFQETVKNMIFRNPVRLLQTGGLPDTVFFEYIEPIQFSLRSWFIRSVGGITFNVSQQWEDMSTYQTTKETTTGYTMSQRVSDNSTINFKNSPNQDGFSGFMITTADMMSDMNVTSCNGIDCRVESFYQKMSVYADFFQNYRNDTVMTMNHAKTDSGIFYLQYFRIEGNINMTATSTTKGNVTATSSTTPQTPESTTKSGITSLNGFYGLVIMCILFR